VAIAPISRRGLFAALAVRAAGAVLQAAGAPLVRQTLFIAGDSTAADADPDRAPRAGWGSAIGSLLGDRVAIDNLAAEGTSARSFLAGGGLEEIAQRARPGDALLVQFGHEDARVSRADRYADPWGVFSAALETLVDGALGLGITPVLLTPIERRRFDMAGNAYASHGDYPAAVRELARRRGVALIDAHAESLRLWQRLGVDGTKEAFVCTDGHVRDTMNLRASGAARIAAIIAERLAEQGIVPGMGCGRLEPHPQC